MKYYDEKGIPDLESVKEMEWLLRYGSNEAIINNKFYIASIVNKYILSRENNNSKIIQVGDTVKIVNINYEYEEYSKYDCELLKSYIGKIGEVTEIKNEMHYVKINGYEYGFLLEELLKEG